MNTETNFTPNAILPLLTGTAKKFQIEIQNQVTSTNTVLKEKAKLSPSLPDQVLIAHRQTAGRGRMGRSFFSPQDTGLYISLLLHPVIAPEHSLLLTTVAAVAVSRAIEDVTGEPTDIKWVNDVYRNGRKLCGILTETSIHAKSGHLEYAIVGIGINLLEPKDGFPTEIQHIAGSLYGKGSCPPEIRTSLTAAILNYFMEYYEKLPETAFLSEYRKRSFLLGQDIYVLSGTKTEDGVMEEPRIAHAEEIDDKLRLVVTYPNGRREALSSGEVSVKSITTKTIYQEKRE